jgi:NitT/TauT family transport system permease protein
MAGSLNTPEPHGAEEFAIAEVPLAPWRRLWASSAFRKALVILLLALAWEIYGRILDNTLLFPPLSDVLVAFVAEIRDGGLLVRAAVSLRLLLIGYGLGFVLALLLNGLAMASQFVRDALETLTAMLNPLPAIALLPLALIWFGLGYGSIIFVLVHSVLWPLALNVHAGFTAVPPTLRMVGRNYGLGGLRYVAQILIPAAFPSILAGLKIGWAFAWRTLIAAELVFGASSGGGGLGWFIYQRKNELEIPSVFAGLLMVVVIGLIVEHAVFRTIEARTVRRWGMQS